MRLIESDFAEYMKDVAEGDAGAPPPDSMAPAIVADGKPYNEYDELKDEKALLEEGFTPDEIQRLQEAAKTKAAIIEEYAREYPDDWSYESFERSDNYTPEIDRTQFRAYIMDFVKKGRIKQGPNTIMPTLGFRTTQAATRQPQAENTAYGAPPEPKDPSKWSKEAKEMHAQMGEANIRSDDGTADGTFRTIYNKVKNICVGRAQKRHLLVYGDPGIGKSTYFSTQLKLEVSDIIAEELGVWLQSSSYTKEITLQIGQLFKFLEEKYGTVFPENEFVNTPIDIRIRNEANNLVHISRLIKKTSDCVEVTFEDDTMHTVADDHLYSIDPEQQSTIKAIDLATNDSVAVIGSTPKVVKSVVAVGSNDVYGFQVESPRKLYQFADGTIHHNTYEVRKSAEAHTQPAARLVYESGDIGSAMSALLAFFFHNSVGKVIILDDNDSMLKVGEQKVANVLKALLDPDAKGKPISVPTTMMRSINVQLEQYAESTFEVDVPRLREGIFSLSIDGKEALYEYVTDHEREELLDMMNLREKNESRRTYTPSWKKYLREAAISDDDDEFDDEEIDAPLPKRRQKTEREEMDDMTNMIADDEGGIPRKFTFNSSVIFVSNLRKDDINPAVLDRVSSVEVNLDMHEYMDRLAKIMHGLCKTTEFNSTPPDLIEWAKKCCWTGLKGVVSCWSEGVPLFEQPVIINRKLTFRAFDEFVDTFMEEAYDYEERVGGGKLSNKDFRDKISKQVMQNTIRKSMLPWLKERNKKV